jgi:hypothetical protein
MAKKKTVSGKKKTAAVKKPAAAKKKTTVAKKKPAAAKKKPVTAKKTETNLQNTVTDDLKKLAHFGVHETDISLLPHDIMQALLEQVAALMNEFQNAAENNLSAKQRKRKIGPGVRNYGFIEKTRDLAETNPQYAQFFNLADFANAIRNIESCRALALLLNSFARAVTNTMLIYSDDAYSMALDYYHTVQRQAKRGDPTAMELERILKIFFRRTKPKSAEPTITQTEKDVHAILTHHKDGKIIIEGDSPKLTAGTTKVIDEVNRGRAAIKETGEVNIKE